MVSVVDVWHPQRYIGVKGGLPKTIFAKAPMSRVLIRQINDSCRGKRRLVKSPHATRSGTSRPCNVRGTSSDNELKG
jgi:hypothetical protein